jgi:hypothetical protein
MMKEATPHWEKTGVQTKTRLSVGFVKKKPDRFYWFSSILGENRRFFKPVS